MTESKKNLEQLFQRVSTFKFEDVDRQKQHDGLMAGLNLIVEKYTFDQIWNDIGLMETFTQKLEAILDLLQVENEASVVWDESQCVEWVEQLKLVKISELLRRARGQEPLYTDSAHYVDEHFIFERDQIIFVGDFDLQNKALRVLPSGLTVIHGYLDLNNTTEIYFLPKSLRAITGMLNLANSQVRELPAGLTSIGGFFDLRNSEVRELPAELITIGGGLYLGNSQVQELPAGLTSIGGGLFLNNSQLREFPAGLTTIGGDLFLENSQITDIPDSLRIEANVYAKGCPQSLIDKLNKMKEKGQIKGNIITE